MHGAINPYSLLRTELDQRTESGYDTAAVRVAIDGLGGVDALTPEQANQFFDDLESTSLADGWAFAEPSDFAGIAAAVGSDPAAAPYALDDTYRATLKRAWAGRIAGNMLGKPVEGWDRASIRTLLEQQNRWPLNAYFPALETTGEGLPPYVECWVDTTEGRIDGSSRDDDVDYTILNLSVLRQIGPAFTTHDIAAAWLTLLPALQTYTAERAAIRNLLRGDLPADAAKWRNPYREYIGASIRADIFGYIAPGDPGRAARMAYADAALSHTENGIYGEMWCAALIAAAFTAETPGDAIAASLTVIPPKSRLYDAVDATRRWHADGLTWEEARDNIDAQYGHYGWVHAVNNAAVVTAGVLWGEGDFTKTISLTVQGGLDTDSNGATAGSVAGILAAEIPEQWVTPLQDTVRSAVFGYDGTSITQLVEQTAEVALAMREGDTPSAPHPGIPRDIW